MPIDDPAIARMQELITLWEPNADQRMVFLSCYLLMTRNMLAAIERGEFADPPWVGRLLHRFADYYFIALDAYDQDSSSAPLVWQLAHNVCRSDQVSALQKLVLGVNAHINYDLALTLVDLLEPEWNELSSEGRSLRHADHLQVNEIIVRTIDSVQDQVLEPGRPLLDLVDNLLGPLDELLVSRLIGDWRETVWENAARLLDARAARERDDLLHQVELHTLELGGRIGLRDWRLMLPGDA